MSSADESLAPVSNPSRLSNGTYPASDVSGPNAADSDSASADVVRPDDLPTVEERLSEIVAEYGDRAFTPVAESHGTKLRGEALAEPEETEYEVETGGSDTRTVRETVAREAHPWIAVVEAFLRDYESYRDKWLRMAKGRPETPEREEFLIPLYNSYAPEYQQKQYARLKAMKRQFIGESAEESPTGEEYAGAFEEPVTVLLGLTSSSMDGDDHRPPVEHDREIRDAWGGSDGVRRTLRYVLQDKLDLDSSEYAWWWQSEPHPGGGAASGYSHSHPVVVLDAAAVDGEQVDAETFRPVVAKHLAECPGAEPDAHRIREEGKSAVNVRHGDEIQDFAGYVSEYLSVCPDDDLLERPAEYIMWAASQWATTTQKYSKSRTATAAIDADRCHQEYADPDARQDTDHGGEVVRSERRGVEFECACCGSEFGVPQSPDTLTEARLVAADGGVVAAETPPRDAAESGESRSLRSRWQDAREAVVVSEETRERECGHESGAAECPLCCPDGVTVDAEVPVPADATADPAERAVESFERPPQWSPDAVVRRAAGEESPIGTPGGVDYGEVVVEGVGSIFDKVGRQLLPEWLEGPEPWTDAPVSESAVRSGELPPPELVRKEYAERLSGPQLVEVSCPCGEFAAEVPTSEDTKRLKCPECGDVNRLPVPEPSDGAGGAVTAKEWAGDWYAERYERDGESPEPFDRAVVRRYVESHPSASVVEVMGATGSPPSARSFVVDLVAE
jgi:hypothetical protein